MNSRLRIMHEYPGYYSLESGEIVNSNNEIISPKYDEITKSYYYELIINNRKVIAYQLQLICKYTFGALIDLPIKYRDGDSKNLSSTNIYFIIPEETQAQFESPYTEFVQLGDQLFRRIPNFPNYFISEYGLVYSIWWRKIMTITTDKDGYFFIRLAIGNSEKKNMRISRLVYETFNGSIDESKFIDHYDGNITHNHITNLQLLSPDDNTLKGHTFDIRREEISSSVVHEICRLINKGQSLEEIFANPLIGPSFPTLQSFTNFCLGLVRGFYFREVSSKYDLRNFHYYSTALRKYQDTQVIDICKMLEEGKSKSYISETLGIPMPVIKNIYNRTSWREVSAKYNF